VDPDWEKIKEIFRSFIMPIPRLLGKCSEDYIEGHRDQ